MTLLWLSLVACRLTDSGDSGDSAVTVAGEDLLMLSETGRSRVLFMGRQSGVELGAQCMDEVRPERCPVLGEGQDAECLMFGLEHRRDGEDESLLLAWSWRDRTVNGSPGAILEWTPGRPPVEVFSVERLAFDQHMPDFQDGACADSANWIPDCNLNMTHVVVESPEGRWWVAADTLNSRLLWLEPDGAGGAQVFAVLDDTHPDWDAFLFANNLEVFEESGRTWMLSTFKSGDHPDVAERNTGRIALWDVTDPSAIEHVWSYPESGYLAAPHHGRVIRRAEGDLLLYAHSLGAGDSFESGQHGSVGLASFSVDSPPVYLGEGILPEGVTGLGFLRDVEPSPEGDSLFVVDSGCENPDVECTLQGQLVEVAFPDDWQPAGLSGAFDGSHGQQLFRDLSALREPWAQGLSYPFEIDVLPAATLGPALSEAGLGPCAAGR